MDEEEKNNTTPINSPRKENDVIQIPASPPKYVTMDEFLNMNSSLQKMQLAHRIAMDDEFKLRKVEVPDNSLHKAVHDMMHKAFWDILEEEITSDPLDYTQCLSLIKEIKDMMLELALPNQANLKEKISEVLDMKVLQQQIDNEVFDMFHYSNFIVKFMATSCAPARDEEIKNLQKLKEIVPLFKEIFRLLEEMKLDLANFQCMLIKPHVQQYAVDYEKAKFSHYMKSLNVKNLDGLLITKEWLMRNADKLKAQSDESEKIGAGRLNVYPVHVITESMTEVLFWDNKFTYPETLCMDMKEFQEMNKEMETITYICSLLLITYNTIGTSIAAVDQLKANLKNHILVLIGTASVSELSDQIVNIALQIVKDVNQSLKSRDFPELSSDIENLLLDQIKSVNMENNIYKIIRSRLISFTREAVKLTTNSDMKLPAGVSIFSNELTILFKKFLKLINHNRAVYSTFYGEIIQKIL